MFFSSYSTSRYVVFLDSYTTYPVIYYKYDSLFLDVPSQEDSMYVLYVLKYAPRLAYLNLMGREIPMRNL